MALSSILLSRNTNPQKREDTKIQRYKDTKIKKKKKKEKEKEYPSAKSVSFPSLALHHHHPPFPKTHTNYYVSPSSPFKRNSLVSFFIIIVISICVHSDVGIPFVVEDNM